MRHLVSALRAAAALGAAAALAACAAHPPSQRAGAAKPPAATAEFSAPGGDWRALRIVPFGTALKDVPFALGEVIVFHDSGQPAEGDRESAAKQDCYVLSGTAPPSFFARQPEDYRLCFAADRLNRIEAAVKVPSDGAVEDFGRACTAWRGRLASDESSTRCEGRDGSMDFRAELSPAGDEASLSITLIDRGIP